MGGRGVFNTVQANIWLEAGTEALQLQIYVLDQAVKPHFLLAETEVGAFWLEHFLRA